MIPQSPEWFGGKRTVEIPIRVSISNMGSFAYVTVRAIFLSTFLIARFFFFFFFYSRVVFHLIGIDDNRIEMLNSRRIFQIRLAGWKRLNRLLLLFLSVCCSSLKLLGVGWVGGGGERGRGKREETGILIWLHADSGNAIRPFRPVH